MVRGWINYYGRFYRSRLTPTLRHINEYLLRWAKGKFKRFRRRTTRTRTWLKDRRPTGAGPVRALGVGRGALTGWMMGAG